MDFFIPMYSNFEILFDSILKILLNYVKVSWDFIHLFTIYYKFSDFCGREIVKNKKRVLKMGFLNKESVSNIAIHGWMIYYK